MEFLELEINNFLSINKETLSLENRGVLLITGENGAGKSSLTSKAISWALFGQTVRGVKGDAVVHVANASGTSSVKVKFRVGGKVHTVLRSRNPTSLELDGQRFRVPAETQRAIEQLVGRDLDSFMAADYFGQDRPLDFLAMTPTAQMETMEAILRLSRLDHVVAVAKEKAAEERANVEAGSTALESNRGRVAEIERQVGHAAERYTELQQGVDARQDRREELARKEMELRREILKGPVHLAKDDREVILSRLTRAHEDRKQHETQDSHYRATAMHARNEVATLRSRLRNIVDEVCPTCGGKVHAELTNELRAEQAALSSTYEALLQRQNTVAHWLAHSVNTRAALLSRVEELQRDLDARDDSIQRFEERLDEINKERVGLDVEDQRGKAVMLELVTMIDNMARQRSDFEGYMATLEKQIQRATSRLSMLNYWSDIFGKTFKNMILEQALPFLQERTAYHLQLLNNPEIKVSFSTQKILKSGEERQQFSVVASRNQGGQSEMALSGGERQMVSFAVGLALSELADSQTGSPSNLMILDEPFSMLSAANSEAVVHYVTKELVKRKATILLISNDDRMKSLVPGGIHVERGDDGYSRVV